MNDQDPQMRCDYEGDREDALITYIYGEDGPATRAFEAHLASCAVCRQELDELHDVRGRLVEWAPPEPLGNLIVPRTPAPPSHRLWRTLGEIPLWAQVAAASLIIGLSTGLANLDVRYRADGLTIRSGWWTEPAPAPAAGQSAAPWRADLASLASELRSEIGQVRSATPVGADAGSAEHDEALLRQVRNLMAESDRRHQRELALRVGEVVRDVNTQRRADLVNIDRTLGQLQNDMGIELLKQREQLNNYVLQVSSQK